VATPLHFFFYGTLLAGSDNPAARAVHAHLHAIGSASVAGRLWAIPDAAGWYPALVAEPGQVHGVLYSVMDGFGPEDLAQLDEWEDFRPDRPAASLYLREAMLAIDAHGVSVMAQVYRFNQPLPMGALAIPQGDFQAWLDASGHPAYAG